MKKEIKFPIIEISGNAIERGLQYGEIAREYIRRSIDYYKENVVSMLREDAKNWNQLLELTQRFVSYISEYDNDIFKEIKGIAKGSNSRLEEILFMNLRTELLYGSFDECTSLAIAPKATKNNITIVGGNWDFHPGASDFLIIVKIKQSDKPDIFLITEAGQIAKMGMNSAGIGQMQNGLFSGHSRLGVPYYATLRNVLNSENISQAIKGITNVKRASSANFMIGEKTGEIFDVETSPKEYDVLKPINSVLVHTNHYTSKEINVREDIRLDILPDSLTRLEQLNNLLSDKKGQIDVETIKTVLRGHSGHPCSVCRHVKNDLEVKYNMRTIVSVIMDLTNSIIWLTDGPPCENEYIKMKINF